MNASSYLVQINLYMLLFYAFYFAVLRNETFFKMNRFYLVGSAVLSLFIPLVNSGWIKDLLITEKVQALTQTVTRTIVQPSTQQVSTPYQITESQSSITVEACLWLVYALVSLAFLLNFFLKLYKVKRLLNSGTNGQAFSFFGIIAVDEGLESKETIMHHELVHARQWHSADVIFFELLLAFNWFNPIIYFYRAAIKNIHEFIADESAASTLEDRSAYALLLVSNAFNTQPQKLTNSFFNQSLLKRRIIMLHKTKSRKVAILKYGLSVPLFAGMLIISSATGADAKIIKNFTEKIQPVRAVNTNPDLNPVGDLRLKISPAVAVSGKNKTKKISPKEQPQSNLDVGHANLEDYTWNYNSKIYNENFKEGLLFISFEVNEAKKAVNFKITKSDGFEWQDDYLNYLNKFNDTIALEKGTYQFCKGYMYAGNEEKFPKSRELMGGKDKVLFVGFSKLLPIFIAKDETKEEAGKIVNYISKTPLTDPIILIDGKEATYKKVEIGFKLDETIYPKTLKTIQIFRGDAAVAEYNESARRGLIVIVTKEPAKTEK